MDNAHTEELIHIKGPEGVRLAGAVFRPSGGDIEPAGITWVHGAWDNFYVPTLVHLSRTLARCGYLSVTGNNRGHDLATALHVEGRAPALGGAWWEDLEDSADDVAAWVGCTVELGSRDVVLAGHSLGALKAIAYQAQRCDPRVRGVVLASAPSPSLLAAIVQDAELRAEAEGMVAQGRGSDLLPFGTVPSFLGTVSARTFLSLSRAAGETYDVAIARLHCPLFAFYGTEEAHIGTRDDLEAIQRLARAAPRVDIAMIQGADHHYRGHRDEVAIQVARWIQEIAQ
ncbi:MAG: alpha/beta fold hydrolase [Anaerolineae bacterium]|nr:alpha/beta fold hydrolase [Anaerolineae bacterium]